MLKKVTAIIAVLMSIFLVSCNSAEKPASSSSLITTNQESESMLERLRKIEKNWTIQQVIDLLGKPDRYGERSVVAEFFYTVDKNTEATIAFWSSGIEITLHNMTTGEKTTLLSPR